MGKLKLANPGLALFTEIVGLFLYFPIWWYSVGLIRFIKKVFSFWQGQYFSLGVFVWLKNIFVPMYGQSDFAGRIISFFVRLVQILVRIFIVIIWLLLCLLVIVLWLALPLFIIYLTAIQLSI